MGVLTSEGRMRRRTAGFSLIEVMVALTVLLFGMLAMMQSQIVSLSWNQSSRSYTRAMEYALELRAGLEQLPYGDDHLKIMSGSVWGSTPPTNWGSLFGSPSAQAAATAWSDSKPIPGVTLDDDLERDPLQPGKPLYARRWTVWGYKDAGLTSMDAGALIIAISVIYLDKGSGEQREALVYTQRVNPAAVFANLSISQ